MKITVEDFLSIISCESEEVEKFKLNNETILQNMICDFSDNFSQRIGSVFFDCNKFSEKEICEKGQQALIVVTNKNLPLSNALHVDKNTTDVWFEIMENLRGSMNEVFGIAVTGSVGKTTTKDMIYQVLCQDSQTEKNPGSSNGKYGFAKGFSRVTPDTRYFIMEMGLSHPRPVFEPISKALCPQICVITNIGTAHIENFKNQDEILTYKLCCAKYMPKESGCFVLNGDDKIMMGRSYESRTITYGIENSRTDYWAKNIVCTADGVDFTVVYQNMEHEYRLNIPGRHNVYAALCAIAVADLRGISYEKIRKGLEEYKTSGMRQNVVDMHGQKRIIDCFNANRESMISAIDMLSLMEVAENGRRVCVFGDMLACGTYTEEHHSFVGEYAVKKNIDVLITYGRYARYAAEAASRVGKIEVYSFLDAEDISQFLRFFLTRNDVVLFKSSHDVHMDRILARLDEVVNCASACLVRITESGYEEIIGKNRDEQRQIAGLTKLMTALVAFEQDRLDEYVYVEPQTWALGSCETDESNRYVGVKVRDLIYAVIFEQKNEIAKTIAGALFDSAFAFVKIMNAKAREIGMNHTCFSNVIGLDSDRNYSTAQDMTLLLLYMNQYDLFQRMFQESTHVITYKNGGECILSNRNQVDVKGSHVLYKRGKSKRSLECIASLYDSDHEKYAAVILGATLGAEALKELCDYQTGMVHFKKRQVGIVIGGTEMARYQSSLQNVESVMKSVESDIHCSLFIVSKIGQWYYYDGDVKEIRDDSWERSEHAHRILFSPMSFGNTN
ncbi:MAG: Mur ligase family protein, partial [Lachnospiraceae bacterium]